MSNIKSFTNIWDMFDEIYSRKETVICYDHTDQIPYIGFVLDLSDDVYRINLADLKNSLGNDSKSAIVKKSFMSGEGKRVLAESLSGKKDE